MSTITRTGDGLREGLERLEPGLDRIEWGLRLLLKWISIAALVGIVVFVNVNVFFRYVLSNSLSWPGGTSVILNIWVTYVGGAVAYYVGDHVSVQYIHQKLPANHARAVTVFINGLVGLLGFAMLWWGSQLAISQASSRTVYEVLGITSISLFWTRIPLAIGGCYLVFEAGRQILKTLIDDLEDDSYAAAISLALFIVLAMTLYLARIPFPGQGVLEIAAIFGLLIVLIVINTPIAFAMALSMLIFLLFFPNSLDILMPLLVIQQMGQALSGFSILAIPLFIYAGRIMTIAGITSRIIEFANLLVGRMRAGLSHVNVVASMLFAGISGSAVADTAAVGSILIPAMEDEGYDTGYTCAVTCSSSVIGPIIPPSIIMIIYAITVPSVSVAGLFMAGVVPGLLFGLGIIATTYVVGYRTDWEKFPEVEHRDRPTAREAGGIVKDTVFALIMPLIIIGGILSGAFTATEAGGVAVLYAIVVGLFVYREMTLAEFIDASYSAVTMSGVTLFIIGAAKPITQVMAIKGVPEQIAAILLSTTSQGILLVLLIVALLSILALFIESIANILLWAPVFAPLVVEVGIDPLHFAIVMIMTLAMGMITPPLGVTLFVAAPIANTNIETIAKNIVFFFLIEFLVLVTVILVPEIALWLPRTLGYG
ncbi:TRAP transporter large permease [Halomarina halobia]|uniref:TRAP transporter large permease n=1 Tax=Halomarina halobia TaxID=3033386 RepID=UPI0023E8869A|nr:TRAP transporter large permease subunit [Halomarina sp. PSR21]